MLEAMVHGQQQAKQAAEAAQMEQAVLLLEVQVD
jgi:hypothetical protein